MPAVPRHDGGHGQFFAHNQVKKSVTNRANRAKRGRPACGRPPFGRTFDKATESWGIDPVKQAFIARVAEHYLAGESLRDIAKEAGVNYPNLHKTLLHRCGGVWAQSFKCPDINVDVETVTAVPRLLGEETVLALAERTHANKIYKHGCLRHAYPLSRMVFCAECGYAMDGQFAAVCGRRYHRHTYAETLRPCPLPHPRGTARADGLEAAVVRTPTATSTAWRGRTSGRWSRPCSAASPRTGVGWASTSAGTARATPGRSESRAT